MPLLNHTLAYVSKVHEGSSSPKICILGINGTHISTCCCGLNKAAGLGLRTPGALKLSNHYLLLAWKAIFDHLNPKRLAETLKIDQTLLQNRHSFTPCKHGIQSEIKAGILIIYKMFSAVLTVVLALTEDTKRENFPSGLRKSAVPWGTYIITTAAVKMT